MLDGAPLAGATVRAGSATRKTDAAGKYTFKGLMTGKYLVHAEALGFTIKPAKGRGVKLTANVTGVDFTSTCADASPQVKGKCVDKSGAAPSSGESSGQAAPAWMQGASHVIGSGSKRAERESLSLSKIGRASCRERVCQYV